MNATAILSSTDSSRAPEVEPVKARADNVATPTPPKMQSAPEAAPDSLNYSDVVESIRANATTKEKIEALFKSSPYVKAIHDFMDARLGERPSTTQSTTIGHWWWKKVSTTTKYAEDQYCVPVLLLDSVGLALSRTEFVVIYGDRQPTQISEDDARRLPRWEVIETALKNTYADIVRDKKISGFYERYGRVNRKLEPTTVDKEGVLVRVYP